MSREYDECRHRWERIAMRVVGVKVVVDEHCDECHTARSRWANESDTPWDGR